MFSFLYKTCWEPYQDLSALSGEIKGVWVMYQLQGLKDSYGEDDFSTGAHRKPLRSVELVNS